jgi:hypothetical protein
MSSPGYTSIVNLDVDSRLSEVKLLNEVDLYNGLQAIGVDISHILYDINPLVMKASLPYYMDLPMVDFERKFSVSTTVPNIDKLPTVIETDRLILRPLLSSDHEGYHSVYIQKEAMDLLGYGPDENKEWTKCTLDSPQRGEGRYGIFLKNSEGSEGELIGWVTISPSHTKEWPDISYVLKQEH